MSNPTIRILVITSKSPYPPAGGAAIRNWQNITNLTKYGSVGICYISVGSKNTDATPVELPGIAFLTTHTVSKPTLPKRILYRLRSYAWWITKKGTLTDIHYSSSVEKELNQIFDDFKPELIVFEEIWLYCYLRVFQERNCRIIYDAHNVESLLFKEFYQTAKSKSIREKFEKWFFVNSIIAMEKGFVQQVNQIWSCSEQDAQLLHSLNPKADIKVVPNGVNVTQYDSVFKEKCLNSSISKSEYCTLIFTATFGYAPNAVAAELLINQIFPQLQAIHPNYRLLLVGSGATPLMQTATQNNPNIIITGRVPDVIPYLADANIAVVPLLQGGGTRIKILEAFAAGLPVVSTSKGVEGIDAEDKVHLLIHDEIEQFVQGIIQIWTEPEIREKLIHNAHQLVHSRYSWEAASQTIAQGINSLRSSGDLMTSKILQ